MENYLYFANDGQNDASGDAVMYPASHFLGMVPLTNTTSEIFFMPKDGTETIGDGCLITHGAGKFKELADELASLMSGSRNNTNNFTVVVDLNTNLPANEGAITATGLSGVTALTITTQD